MTANDSDTDPDAEFIYRLYLEARSCDLIDLVSLCNLKFLVQSQRRDKSWANQK